MMTRRLLLNIITGGLCGLALLLTGCQSRSTPPPAVREYQIRGRVESIDLEKRRAIVAHDDIEGYMKAMTMGFSIPDEEVLRGLKSGDQIEARLIFDSRTNLSWLENVRRTGEVRN